MERSNGQSKERRSIKKECGKSKERRKKNYGDDMNNFTLKCSILV